MRLAALALAAAALAACRTEEADRWRYERVLYEEYPRIESRSDSRRVFDALSAREELTLEECYRMALHRSEALAIDGEDLVRIQTQYEQAVASLLPRVSFKGSYTRREKTELPATGGSVQQTFTDPDQTQYQVALRQPIFSGLREFYTLRQGNALYASREHDLRHARLLLFADVADGFYAVLQLERDIATIEDSLRLARERLQELVERNRVGISRRSEVLAQEAEAASTEAALERLRGALAVAWEALKFLTGLDSFRKLLDTTPDPADPPPVETFIARARAERSDVQSLRRQVEAAGEGVGVARAGYFPTVTLDANYYTHREGFSKDIDYDAVFSFEIPLFEGGATQAAIREARSLVRASEFRLGRLEREIVLQVNRAYADLRSLRSELASLEKAVASARENHEIVQAEYRRAIATNIEVLAAFNTLQQATLARDRARFQSKLARIRLDVQAGVRPEARP